jgi:hypothetical protein
MSKRERVIIMDENDRARRARKRRVNAESVEMVKKIRPSTKRTKCDGTLLVFDSMCLVASYFDIPTTMAGAQVSKFWNRVLSDNRVWDRHIKRVKSMFPTVTNVDRQWFVRMYHIRSRIQRWWMQDQWVTWLMQYHFGNIYVFNSMTRSDDGHTLRLSTPGVEAAFKYSAYKKECNITLTTGRGVFRSVWTRNGHDFLMAWDYIVLGIDKRYMPPLLQRDK